MLGWGVGQQLRSGRSPSPRQQLCSSDLFQAKQGHCTGGHVCCISSALCMACPCVGVCCVFLSAHPCLLSLPGCSCSHPMLGSRCLEQRRSY